MKRWTGVLVAVAGGIVGGMTTAVAAGTLLWNRSTAKTVARLLAEEPAATEVFSPKHLEGLPKPVVRYFQFALKPGQPLVHKVRVEQTGMFRAGGFDAPWSPFTAVQNFSTEPPSFVWDAAIRMAPLLTVRVRDSYIGGAGGMEAKLASLVTVVDQSDTPELNAGALQRYLAEAVWFPTALLPSQGVTWEAMDDDTARATLTDAGTTVSLEFQFGENGEIVRAYTPQRFREVKGKYVPIPWACYYRSYSSVAGTMVPREGEVEWILPEGRLSYWRGRIKRVEQE